MVKVPASLLKKLENVALSRSSKGRRNRNRTRRQRVPKQMSSKIHPDHCAVMHNPSNASLVGLAGVYDGEQGHITRFTSDISLTLGATQTAGVLFYHPNTGFGQTIGAVASSTALTSAPFFGTGITPGATFLAANARKIRGVASGCKFGIPSLSLTTIVGEVAVGVCSADLFAAGNSFSVDQLFTYAGARGPIKKTTMDINWYPGSFDSKYATFQSSAIASGGSDLSDTNVYFWAIRGLPVNTVITNKLDWVCEWVPAINTGLSPSFATSSGSDHQESVAHLHKVKPGWWHTIKSDVEAASQEIISKALSVGKGRALQKIETYAVRAGEMAMFA
jgi:hypothetical protein